ncbi:aspartate dehydrogenase [Brevibacillus sp. B_LB10_24]|uniref:aspartate dehydrogenase n=1 Tax=Brevibacillus sp. B_LB10_24 TaxID=3380645 RepID=UPI0038BD251E
MKIGLIGGGNIGKFLLKSVNLDRKLQDCRIESVLVRQRDRADELCSTYQTAAYDDLEAFLASGIDLVVEAANVDAVRRYAEKIVEQGKDLLLISVGALVDAALYQQLNELCCQNQARVLLPSGAIGGLDVIRSAMVMNELESVTITTRKPPEALLGRSLTAEQVVFEGSAKEAISRFPQNINVAIVLSLAGLGSERTRVKIVADPCATRNTHFIEAVGSFGRMAVKLENDPMPGNPKTSYLAALSALSTLKKQTERICIG